MKDPKYRLLVLDLDGTLTNNRKEITPHTERVLLEAQKQGLIIVLASGRPTFGIAPIADRLHLAEYGGYILAYNGGQIIRWSDRKVIYENMLDPAVLPYFYERAKSNGFEILSYAGDVAHNYFIRTNIMYRINIFFVCDLIAIGTKIVFSKKLIVIDNQNFHMLTQFNHAIQFSNGCIIG